MSKIIFFMMFLVYFVGLLGADAIPFIQLKEVATSHLPDEIIIPEIKSFVVDSNGNVFGFAGGKNKKECYVIKWDSNLKFIKKFVRQGLGPGEISMIGRDSSDRLSIDPSNGNVVVIDYNPTKLVFFTNEGEYIKDINLLQKNTVFDYYKHFQSLGNGSYVAFKTLNNTQSTECNIFSIEPFIEKKVYNFNDRPVFIDKNSGIFFSDLYGSVCLIDSDYEFFVIANSQTDGFQVFNNKGVRIVEVLNKSKQNSVFSSQEIEYIKTKRFSSGFLSIMKQNKTFYNKLINRIKENKNPIRDIRIGGEYVYLFLVNDDITVENKIPTVIYDLKGDVVKTVYFKKIPIKIWKKFAFYSEFAEEDNPIIRKYEITNIGL